VALGAPIVVTTQSEGREQQQHEGRPVEVVDSGLPGGPHAGDVGPAMGTAHRQDLQSRPGEENGKQEQTSSPELRSDGILTVGECSR